MAVSARHFTTVVLNGSPTAMLSASKDKAAVSKNRLCVPIVTHVLM